MYMDTITLRPGNGALDYLLKNYPDRGEKFALLVTGIPNFADAMSRDAKRNAEILLKGENLSERIISDKCALLADCVFDLMLVPCFEEVAKYSENSEFASVFVDALLYEVTGQEAGLPTEAQIRREGTHHTRGVAKYNAARGYIKGIRDVEGWIFGEEYAAIVSDRVADWFRIVSVSPLTLLIRQHSRWTVRYFLYGTLPSDEEQRKLDSVVSGLYEKMAQNAEQISV